MPRTFAVARPYEEKIQDRIHAFLGEMGFEPKAGALLPPGTLDEIAARMIDKWDVDLLLLPFHLHRAADGTPLDAVGIALLLPPRFDDETSPILMPVSKYSWEASFHRRMALLKEVRPKLAARIVTMQEHEIGSLQIAQSLGVKRLARRNGEPETINISLKNFPKTSAMSGSLRAARATRSDDDDNES